ncbi:lipid II flippase Amj family protein [Parerythrobacter aurantius]|uniref:lipid II flippase Amj family protein n=1 Tax=Parerythrobacter aurantius TaxID=3127706 RepID=UPI00324DE914
MDTNLALLCALTAIINLIGALAYSARIAGVRTRRIAMSFALFNMLVLVSRLSNGFLAPLVAKRVEVAIHAGREAELLGDFRWMMASASIAVLVGILLMPTGQRLFARAIDGMRKRPSLMQLALRSATPSGMRTLADALTVPKVRSLGDLQRPRQLGWSIVAANVLAQALLAVGVFASIYAGVLEPQFRVTASQLSAVVNGFATILLFAFIDPHLSVLTDDVIDGDMDEASYRRAVIWISGSRLAGTVLAQALFLPAALAVAMVARVI